MDNTVEIIKEARKAGMQTALILFAYLQQSFMSPQTLLWSLC